MLPRLDEISKNIEAGSIKSVYENLIKDIPVRDIAFQTTNTRDLANVLFHVSSRKPLWEDQTNVTSELPAGLKNIVRGKQDLIDQLTEAGRVLVEPTTQVLEQSYGFLLAEAEGQTKDMVIDFIERIDKGDVELFIDFDVPRDEDGVETQFGDGKGNISFIKRDGAKPILRFRPTIILDATTSPHYNLVYSLIAAFDAAEHFYGYDQYRELNTKATIRRILRRAEKEGFDHPLPPTLREYAQKKGLN